MKRLLAAALAAALVLTSAPAVSKAAVTVQNAEDVARYDAGEVVTVTEGNTSTSIKKNADGTTTITAVKDKKTKKTLKIANAEGTNITSISSSAFKNTKAKTIDLNGVQLTKLNKNQFKGSKAKKVKMDATKLKASKISKKALKGSKIEKMTLKCKNKKEFNKLVKKLKSAGGKNITFIYKKA